MLDFSNDPHKRWNPLLGEWVKVSPHRTKRPWQGKTEAPVTNMGVSYDETCYLCPGNDRSGGQKNPNYKDTFVFDNDFMALLPNTTEEKWTQGDLFKAQGVRGLCKVMCFSPSHNLTLPLMEPESVIKVVETWANEYKELGNMDFINHVQIFENRGDVMGCSNPHPHCQIWAEGDIPDIPQKEIDNQMKWMENNKEPMLVIYAREELDKQERIVCSNTHFIAVVPFWAVWPFEILVLPINHRESLTDLNKEEIDAFADILRQVTTRYDNLFSCSFPYSMGIHQKPTDNKDYPGFQMHAHFYPPLLRSASVKKFMVGYEMMAGPQRDISAEQAAKKLRELSNIHFLKEANNG